MQLYYKPSSKPPIGKALVFAFQQLLAILAATIAVPMLIGNGMSTAAALVGAGAGTLIYQIFTKFKSPVFLGSSFAFLRSMGVAFSGATLTASMGFVGLLLGAVLAGLVYVVISFIVKRFGTKWIDKVMPAVIIGPTVAIIGLSLAGNAVADAVMRVGQDGNGNYIVNVNSGVGLICALVTLGTVIASSVYGKKMFKMIPFIIGIFTGYLTATIFTVIGIVAKVPELEIIDFSLFKTMEWGIDFTFFNVIKGIGDFAERGGFWSYFGTIAVAYVPVAFVVFAEHLADHKNLSSIIEHDLTKDPGLDRTLLGDGVGSMVGAFFGGCPNTTYGESVGCVAISGNASVFTITITAIMAIAVAFFAPFITFLSTIPKCVMGGVCISLYGFIAVSGLKMIQKIDLNDNRNLFIVSVILIAGVGGLALSFGEVKITNIACALILGIACNLLTHVKCKCAKCETEVESVEVPEEKVEVAEEPETKAEEKIEE